MMSEDKCQACIEMKEWDEFELVREEQNSVYGDCTAVVTIGEGNLLSVDVKYEHEYGSCQTLNYVEINYCPMCGEKLEEK